MIGQRPPAIDLSGVTKTYGLGEATVHALAGIDLVVERGEYVAVMGASGSGKSTLMNIIGCLDGQTRGRYRLDGIDVRRLDEHQLSLIRNRKIGFVFQSFNLIPDLHVFDNVDVPLRYRALPAADRKARIEKALELVGLSSRARHLPSQLSGGQQQRVAIARVLAGDPRLILADEPTGNLDSASSRDVLGILRSLNEAGRTIILITHDPGVAAIPRRVLTMSDGRLREEVAA